MKSILIKIKNDNHYLVVFPLCVIFFVFSSCGKSSSGSTSVNNPNATVNYAGTFMKTDSTTTSANGSVKATFNTVTNQITYTITWHSLTTNPIAMHFHDNGPVIVTLTGYPVATDQTSSGTVTFSNTQAEDLASGLIFVMIHTSKYPGGEIMAPLVKQ